MVSKQLMAASTRPIILAILFKGEDYGYNIIQKVRGVTGGRLEWTDGMLYPVLQRMEMDGLIVSRWRSSDGGRPRRYYRITGPGRAELETELAGWRSVWQAFRAFGAATAAGD